MIELRDLTVRAGQFALERVSFSINKGQYVVLMGRTGQGKTTILEAICGLKPVISGQILIDGKDVSEWSPAARGIGYVPQDLALFPSMTVREHLEFALKLRRVKTGVIRGRVAELSRVLGISHLHDRRPRGLSGGESQRVALGRALSFNPCVLLLDEPLSALDETTRSDMHELLRQVQESTGVTTLHVTHSRDEAAALADRMLVVSEGCVQETSFTRKERSASRLES